MWLILCNQYVDDEYKKEERKEGRDRGKIGEWEKGKVEGNEGRSLM